MILRVFPECHKGNNLRQLKKHECLEATQAVVIKGLQSFRPEMVAMDPAAVRRDSLSQSLEFESIERRAFNIA